MSKSRQPERVDENDPVEQNIALARHVLDAAQRRCGRRRGGGCPPSGSPPWRARWASPPPPRRTG
ncbi:hypothetical protein ACFQHO_13465 [Actinomadura yumaensis]|uniref:hypothetical protein n=1 Tax=Actinomadura yumaensis TaxID=111807 RepID=UPI003623AFDA